MVKGSGGLRHQHAEATKDRVAAAARDLFAARGFAGTTMSAISQAAGVPEQTIYSSLGSKARVLARVTEMWMRETNTRALAEAYLAEPDAGRRLRLFAALNRQQLDAGADILHIYREAARTDASMAVALSRMLTAREQQIEVLLQSVSADLHKHLTVPDALAITLALCVDAVYDTLRAAGWDGTRYEQWLGDALVTHLLREKRPPGRRA